jgi:hypothetical protein
MSADCGAADDDSSDDNFGFNIETTLVQRLGDDNRHCSTMP